MGKPWMPFYVGDYLRDTQHLSTEEHGAYVLLLFECWNAGGELPNDDAKLARIVRMTPTKWRRISETVAKFFQISKNSWSHSRISAELKILADKSEKAAASARDRWEKSEKKKGKNDANGYANAYADAERTDMRTGMRSQCQPQPQPLNMESSSAEQLIPDRAPDPPEPAAQLTDRWPWDRVLERVVDLAGIDPGKGLMDGQAVALEWSRRGFSPDLDILPAVEAITKRTGFKPPRTVGYFTPMIQDRHDLRTAPAARAEASPPAAQTGTEIDRWNVILDAWETSGRRVWSMHQWGMPPVDRKGRHDPNCRAPKQLLIDRGIIPGPKRREDAA
ncbi:MAG: YdaU family protein [Alphaproteobacteria bacterium]|jgi:uncharacterized protein YdaU (DUF1376 family)|nr:YdaU family protein [Alphaproteobacteria bacterium]